MGTRKEIQLVLSCLLYTLVSATIFNAIGSDSGEFDVTYPTNIQSERGLPVCKTNAACSIVHKRFWFKIQVERLCRCPDLYECPRYWSQDSNNYTIMLNNRSQMKFCHNLDNLPTCSPKTPALKVTTNSTTVQESFNRNISKLIIHKSAVVSCICSYPAHWKFEKAPKNKMNMSISIYTCSQLKKCSSNEFCGNIRADHFSAFYQCSCPTGHMCLINDRSLHNVTELLYEGLAYEGHCTSYPPSK